MQVTIFSFLSALLWSSLLIVAIYLLRHTRFKQHFGVLSMVLLYLFCAVRLFLPLEFPHTLIAADGVIYPHIYNLLTRERDMLANKPLVLILCAAWLLRLLPAPGKRLRRTLLAAFFTLCFLAQAHVGRALVVGATGDWDFGIVLRAALDFAADGAQGGIYFNNFPNNQPLMLLLAGLFRLLRACGVTEEYELLVWGMRFGAVLLQLALFFLYLCAARLLGRRAGALALLLGAATAPFLLYAPVYYTDTVTAPIPIAILYCWLRLRAARREGRPAGGCFCAGRFGDAA